MMDCLQRLEIITKADTLSVAANNGWLNDYIPYQGFHNH